MTIKEVLDKFAEHRLVKLPQSNGIRTEDGRLCPLQVATGLKWGYVNCSIAGGLSEKMCVWIMNWADTGRWSMPNKFREKEVNDKVCLDFDSD